MTPAASPVSDIDAIAERFWEAYLHLSPTTATMYGDHRWDDRLDDASAVGRAKMRALAERAGREAAAVPEEGLSVEERITRDMLRIVADLAVEDDDLGMHELRAIDQIQGPQTLLAQIAQFQPANTPEALEAYLERLRGYGALIDAHIELLADGRRSGRTAARIVAERTIDQLKRLLAVPLAEAIVPAMSQVASEADRERVRDVVRDVVYPADRRYLEAIEGDYLAATREQPGLISAPNGIELYRHAIRQWTTLDLDPREVHRVGLEELEEVTRERREISRAEGFGDDIAAYRRSIEADPANQAKTREELVAWAQRKIGHAMAIAPSVFSRLPVALCEVRAVEEFKEKDAPFAYYFPPQPDGSRPGIYYLNTYDLPSRTFPKLAAVTFHEAVPGHHFQIALEMEHPQLNTFRRLGSRMVGGAFAEGWGLYCERLADELGLYESAAERFMMLDMQAWRASRLITDSGMHGLGWSRQRSIEWLLETGLSATDSVIETDRFIVWPGQALTYMTGMREIRRLRQELEAREGRRFDLRRFHDELIGHGSLPLATLERELPRWLAADPQD